MFFTTMLAVCQLSTDRQGTDAVKIDDEWMRRWTECEVRSHYSEIRYVKSSNGSCFVWFDKDVVFDDWYHSYISQGIYVDAMCDTIRSISTVALQLRRDMTLSCTVDPSRPNRLILLLVSTGKSS